MTEEPDFDDISISMSDDLAKEIDACFKKHIGLSDDSSGQVEGLVYKSGRKRIVFNYDMNQLVEFAGVRMTTLEAQNRLAFPDYVKVILGKSDEEKERLRSEREHIKEARKLYHQRL